MGDPQPWTRHELAVIMGPALLEYEADQTSWNAKVSTLTGWYKFDEHKNVNNGVDAQGPLANELVEYLLAIRPPNPGRMPIPFNPRHGGDLR